MTRRHRLAGWLGIEPRPAPARERALSCIGGLLGILASALLAAHLAPPGSAPLLIGATGATAVLLFGLPHGALSQPWPLFGGHLLSAAIGVACARWLGDGPLAAALAVGLAIGAMHQARCLHPPGGATALIAVTGGPDIHALGFGYLLNPVLLQIAALCALAILFNAPFPWRRYPARWASAAMPAAALREEDTLSEGDIAHAVEQLGLVVDVDSRDLRHLFALALQHAAGAHLPPAQVLAGRCYSNGGHGEDWAVRQVQERLPGDRLVYRGVAGRAASREAVCSLDDFARWARYEVRLEQGRWRRLGEEDDGG